MVKAWGEKRYNSLNYFLREKFGEKVFKISLDGGFSCPNRDGSISKGGCIFCSERGSGDFAGDRCTSITEQFNNIKEMMQKKWKSGKFIAYFQAYTNTYAPVEILKLKYLEAISQDNVVGIAIATRPDCLQEEVLDLLQEINKKVYLWVELGLQTKNEDTARLINRGYGLGVFEDAVKRLRERGIDVVVHSILGLPGENENLMLETIRYISKLDVQGIKIHLLHLMKGTSLELLYDKGELGFLSFNQYVELVCEAICMLPENMIIHRLTGDAPRKSLVGPVWSLKKWEVLNAIDDKLVEKNMYQGLYFPTKSI